MMHTLSRRVWRAIVPAALVLAAIALMPIGPIALAPMAARPADDAIVAHAILADHRLDDVLGMARSVLGTDVTAGDGYKEVWIRDLNTFLAVALESGDRRRMREALLTFFDFQGPDGDIPDGYIPEGEARGYYTYRRSPLAPGRLAHKNTAATDQESSLAQAVATYVEITGDRAVLDEVIDGRTVKWRLARALEYVRTARLDSSRGLVWGATTADWGDLQPEQPGDTNLDASSHRSIDVYDNAMFAIAIADYTRLIHDDAAEVARWTAVHDALTQRIRAVLWDSARRQFIAHVYLDPSGSPFPASFDESQVYVHGGTTVAIEAGLLSPDEVREALSRMREDVRAAGAGSIGLTQFPAYPDGAFHSPGMGPFMYQNGGDWDWFGGRMVQQLVRYGMADEAYRELVPMVVRVERVGDFSEWWTRENEPRGSGAFRGAAGVLGLAIERLQAWARAHS
jgi:glycogen debranching enzyme